MTSVEACDPELPPLEMISGTNSASTTARSISRSKKPIAVAVSISPRKSAVSQPARFWIIRALAVGELKLADLFRVVRRELFSGFALGCILGTIGFLRIAIWSMFSNLYGQHWPLVASTVGLALVGVVLWGSLVGSTLPFILRRLGFDPATSSAPFVATLVDVTGLVIYFSVGVVVLRGTLL